MKLIAIFLVSSTISMAQVANKTYTNCSNNTEVLWTLLGQGKPVIIAAKGVDCSICMGQASSMQSFAASNPSVRVWAGMWKRYTATPAVTCSNVNSWNSQFGWNNIFTFIDPFPSTWNSIGQWPYYYTIRPSDSTIVYQGNSFSTASQIALQNVISGLPENAPTKLEFVYHDGTITLNSSNSSDQLTIVSADGKLIPFEQFKNTDQVLVQLTMVPKGIYILILTGPEGIKTGKFIVNEQL